jgi:hypothetical protein
MRHDSFLGAGALLLAAAAGCYTGGTVDPNAARKPRTTEVNATQPADGGALEGIPCEVAELVMRSCATCHGEPLSGGAPNRMLTYADLAAASHSDASRSVAQLSVDRMRDAKAPMPPDGVAPENDVAILERWIAAGMPKGSCSPPVEQPAGPVVSEYDTPTVCTSMTRWTRGDRGSSLMHPGVPCIECHERLRDGPIYTAAGTLYPSAHEPDDCNGVGGSVSVVITDANGATYTLPVNAAGNFFTRTRIAAPYRAKVVSGTKTRTMMTPQSDGDCNVCHSENGSQKAPGRVMAP